MLNFFNFLKFFSPKSPVSPLLISRGYFMETRKEQFQLLNEISYQYSFYLDYLNGRSNYTLAAVDSEDREDAIKYVGSVFRSFMQLPEDEKEVLNKEFFAREEHNWWKSKYSEKQFKDTLFLGIRRFLFYFKEFRNAD